MYEAIFRILDGGTYAAATADSDVRITLWCNEYCDLLHVVGTDADRALDAIESAVGVRARTGDGPEQIVVTETCLKTHDEGNIEQYTTEHDCLLLPPLQYADGSKRCRILAFDPDGLSGLYRALIADGHDVTVEQKRELATMHQQQPLLTLEEVLPELTDRQFEALMTAYDQGYYEVPRETTTAEIAEALGIQRRTAEEHLRRAERKIADALVPYLRG